MPVRVALAGRPVEATDVTWSAVDPGGFESCSFVVDASERVNPGDDILITDGLTVCWHGSVEEPGLAYNGHETYSVQGVGYGSLLKNNPYSMVYIERRLSEFGQTPLPREIALADAGGGYILNDNCGFEIKAGESTGDGGYPALVLFNTNINSTGTRHNIVETWYDAGLGNSLNELSFTYETYDKALGGLNPAGFSANWQNKGILASSDLAAGATGSDLAISGTASVTSTASNMRYAYFEFFYNAVFGPTPGDWKFIVSDVRIKGDHGLTSRGTAPSEGYYPSDIVADALKRASVGFATKIDNATNYVIQQIVYKTKTTPEQIIDDMAKYNGWHWGVWEPSLSDNNPTFYFTAPPTTATTAVSYFDCENMDLVEKFSEMYDTLIGQYSLPNGTAGYVTVTGTHPRIPVGKHHQIIVELGTVGSSAAASTIALFQLRLLQNSSSMAGSTKLPTKLTDGREAHLLRPGRDKLKINNLPNLGSSLGEPPGRVDDFHLRRITVTVSAEGTPSTQVEFDHGADLIEVMQARLSNAAEAKNLA